MFTIVLVSVALLPVVRLASPLAHNEAFVSVPSYPEVDTSAIYKRAMTNRFRLGCVTVTSNGTACEVPVPYSEYLPVPDPVQQYYRGLTFNVMPITLTLGPSSKFDSSYDLECMWVYFIPD
jgi:hypothetical protein